MSKVDYVERLEKLGEVVKAVPPELFDMGVWSEKRECGTVGCAAGHAMQNTWFQQQGLECHHRYGYPMYRGATDLEALADFFGIEGEATYDLFDPGAYRLSEQNAAAKSIFLERLAEVILAKATA